MAKNKRRDVPTTADMEVVKESRDMGGGGGGLDVGLVFCLVSIAVKLFFWLEGQSPNKKEDDCRMRESKSKPIRISDTYRNLYRQRLM